MNFDFLKYFTFPEYVDFKKIIYIYILYVLEII